MNLGGTNDLLELPNPTELNSVTQGVSVILHMHLQLDYIPHFESHRLCRALAQAHLSSQSCRAINTRMSFTTPNLCAAFSQHSIALFAVSHHLLCSLTHRCAATASGPHTALPHSSPRAVSSRP